MNRVIAVIFKLHVKRNQVSIDMVLNIGTIVM